MQNVAPKMIYPLGDYEYQGQIYHLSYQVVAKNKRDEDVANFARPYLVVENDSGSIVEKGLPSWESALLYPDRPMSVAYNRAKARHYRLYNMYRTKEIAEALSALRGHKVRDQNVRNYFEAKNIKALLMSGDYHVPEEIRDEILHSYERKIETRQEKEAIAEYKRTHLTRNQLAKKVGVSRETVRIWENTGKVPFEKPWFGGKLTYTTEAAAYSAIAQLPGWLTKPEEDLTQEV